MKYAILAILAAYAGAGVGVAGWRGLASFAIKLFDFAMAIAGVFIVPVALLFRTPDDHLPRWAWIWDNEDHGTDGDGFWVKRCGATFWCRYKWLAFRNPTFNLARYWLGAVVPMPVVTSGDLNIGDKVGPGKRVSRSWALYEYYKIGQPYQLAKRADWAKKLPKLQAWLIKYRCFRARIGWKLHGAAIGERVSFVYVINPLMPYSGKLQ